MRYSDGKLTLSATDLSSHFECGHKSALDIQVARGKLKAPAPSEIERQILEQRGRDHEAKVLEYYRAQGREVVTLTAQPGAPGQAAAHAAATRDAMRRGAEVIYQGTLVNGDWVGRPDFLVRTATTPLDSGFYAYEPVDAKLAREERARAVLQLCSYADQLEQMQGRAPLHLWLALGGDTIAPVALRTESFLAYYRQAKREFVAFTHDEGALEPYPEPVEFCGVCAWWQRCEKRRRDDDHLSLVAGITRRQRTRLQQADVRQLAVLGSLDVERSISGIESDALRKIRDQARLQFERRTTGKPTYECIVDGDPGTGLELLPQPTPGDLFLDLEGDAFALSGGIEYLFGLIELGQPEFDFVERERPGAPRYLAFWSTTPAEEKAAFERVMDRISTGLQEFPNLHVFHFGHRERVALQTLACRHGTREEQVDNLLRGEVLVDLHTVVRQGLRASVEAYSLKELEVFHGFQRSVELRAAARAMQRFGWWLDSRDADLKPEDLQQTLQRYNEEDCLSTWKLRDWLEERRLELQRLKGRGLTRPVLKKEDASTERDTDEATRVADHLRVGLPPTPAEDTAEQHARRLLADLLGWHRRELKSSYWEYFEARAVPPSEWLENRLILGGLTYEGVVDTSKQSLVHKYTFPEQEHSLSPRPSPEAAGSEGSCGTVIEIGTHHVLIKRGKTNKNPHPRGLRPGKPIESKGQSRQLLAVAESILRDGVEARGAYSAARDLLTRHAPRCGQPLNTALVQPGEDVVAAVKRLCLALDHSVLPIQGPPGAGKTYCATEAIVALAQAGKKVGVTANSHSVILGVLRKVFEVAAARGLALGIAHIGDPDDHAHEQLPFEVVEKGAQTRLKNGELQVVGGTTFKWTGVGFEGAVDVLFVDEAGQMSLANALAASTAAQSLVLVGDPAQLDQPQKGVHPPGADVSALSHIVGDAEDQQTMPEHLGVFLPLTRRLHPDICAFTSPMFYEGKLQSLAGLGVQRINGPHPFDGSGLRFVSVAHEGNTNRSDEEIDQVDAIVGQLLAGDVTFTDRTGEARGLSPRDILVIAPYNSQVSALKQRLGPQIPVGTVDKFQGKEAPIVIFSMTTSSGEEAPRGLEFLYSLNRLNVATSRAQALVILVANPALLKVRCRTPRQLKLVNALCAYLEVADSTEQRAKQR